MSVPLLRSDMHKLLIQFIAAIILALLPQIGLAVCPQHDFADPAKFRLDGDAVMIVTHATSYHDARFSSKRGVDEAVRFAKERRIPVVYLQDGSPDQYYFMEDCDPAYWVSSEGGEVNFDVQPSHLYIVGGHLETCMSTTLHDVLFQWSKQQKQKLTVTYFMDAIYSNGRNIDVTDPYYQDFQRFIGIIIYGRPMGEHWPKLTLLETLGVIVKEEHDIEYLKKILPRYDTTFPEKYRVELQLNNSPKIVLQPGSGESRNVLLFQFVDSALSLANLAPGSTF